MLDVSSLHNHGGSLGTIVSKKNREGCEELSYHGRAANFHDLTPGGLQCGFSSSHADAVGEHCNTDKGIAVTVPRKGGVLILIRLGGIENGNGLVVDGDVDSGNLVVHCRD